MTNTKRAEELAELRKAADMQGLSQEFDALVAERDEARMLYEDACISHNVLAAKFDRLLAQLEVAQAASEAAVRQAQWQASTNSELNALIAENARLAAELAAARGMEPLSEEQIDNLIEQHCSGIRLDNDGWRALHEFAKAVAGITSSKEGQSNEPR